MEAIPDAVNTEALLAHADWVRALARTLVADPHRADDVAQEAWVDALESPPRDARNVRGWFASVVRNAASQARRSETRRTEREKAAAREEALPDTAELVARASLQRDLVGHVLALEEPYRRTILLRFFQGLEVREIAQQEGVELSTVRTRLQRGIAKLRERLDRAWGTRSAWSIAVTALAKTPGRTEMIAATSSAVLAAWIAGSAACIGVVGAIWWSWPDAASFSTHEVAASTESSPGAASNSASSAVPGLTHVDEVDRMPAASLPPIETASMTGSAEEIPRTRIEGRAVDLRGNPIAGLQIRARDGSLARRIGDSIRYVAGTTIQWIPSDPDEERALRVIPGALERFLRERGNPAGLKELLLGIDLSTAGRTAADGSFDLTAHGTRLEIECDDKAWVLACDGWTALRTVHVYVAAPAIDVGGMVIDGSDAPIAAASVEFGIVWTALKDFPFELEGSGASRSWCAGTDREGRFLLERIPAISGGVVRASKDGFQSSGVPEPDRSADDLTIRLKPEELREEPLVRGIVVDMRGSPVEGAWVQFAQHTGTTDASGRFEIEATSYNPDTPLTAVKRGMQAAVIESFGEELPGHPEGLDGIVLRLGGESLTITGRILDLEGEPCRGWKVDLDDGTPCGTYSVNLEAATSGRLDDSKAAETDAEGRFEVGGLRDRSYRIHAWNPGNCLVLVGDSVAAGSRDVEIRMPPDAVRPTVRGTIVSKRGHPVPGVEVAVACVTNRSPGGGFSSKRCTPVLTDASGGFVLTEVSRRNVLISVYGGMIVSTHLELPADGEDVRIEVDVQARFRLDPRAGDAVDSFKVLDPRGAALTITVHRPESTSSMNSVRRRDDGFPTCTVSEEAAVLVLYQGKQELRRVPLDLHPGELQVVVP